MIVINEKLREKTLSTSYLYRGKIINVRQDRVEDARGKISFREIVEHPGAVAVLALTGKGEILFVRQHRQPAGEIMIEIPAGKIEPDEEPLACAQRELIEETGFSATDWEELCCFYPSPGFCDEVIYLYKAEGLMRSSAPGGDPDENIVEQRLKLNEAAEMIRNGKIKDGKTIIAVQHALVAGID